MTQMASLDQHASLLSMQRLHNVIELLLDAAFDSWNETGGKGQCAVLLNGDMHSSWHRD